MFPRRRRHLRHRNRLVGRQGHAAEKRHLHGQVPEVLTGRTFRSPAAAQAAIDEWIAGYDTDRPRQALGNCTRPSGSPPGCPTPARRWI